MLVCKIQQGWNIIHSELTSAAVIHILAPLASTVLPTATLLLIAAPAYTQMNITIAVSIDLFNWRTFVNLFQYFLK